MCVCVCVLWGVCMRVVCVGVVVCAGLVCVWCVGGVHVMCVYVCGVGVYGVLGVCCGGGCARHVCVV